MKHPNKLKQYQTPLLTGLAALFLWYLLAKIDLFERMYEFSRDHEGYQLDEIFAVVPVILLGLLVHSSVQRRIIKKKASEIKTINEHLEASRESLKNFNDHLNLLVEERTARLVNANTLLREEVDLRAKAQETAQQAALKFSRLFSASPTAIFLCAFDDAGLAVVADLNPAARALSGFEQQDAAGRPVAEVLPFPVDSRLMLDIHRPPFAEGRAASTSIATGTSEDARHFELRSFPVLEDLFALECKDTTEQNTIYNKLIQSEKMLSVGGLASGIAHEINNPLGGILQNIQVVSRRLSEDMPANRRVAEELGANFDIIREFMDRRDIYASLEAIRAAGARATQIVSNMLNFSRSGTPHIPEEVNAILDRAVELCSLDFNLTERYDFRRVRITKQYEAAPVILCQPNQIQQVFMNLLVNAAHALHQAEDPEIALRITVEESWARVDVRDNGPGMSADVTEHAFEPFYTTKPVGTGTGLGLSVSYFIVTNNHDGSIEVKSEPGKGTVFTVRLPLA